MKIVVVVSLDNFCLFIVILYTYFRNVQFFYQPYIQHKFTLYVYRIKN